MPGKRPLHPALAQRAAHVKAAHAHLAANMPQFQKLSPSQRMSAVQHHVRSTMSSRKRT